MMNDLDEKMALGLAGLVGRLCAVVEWCIERDGECLGDNPKQLAFAKQVRAEARKRLLEDRALIEGWDKSGIGYGDGTAAHESIENTSQHSEAAPMSYEACDRLAK
jgi:hypothetical protein